MAVRLKLTQAQRLRKQDTIDRLFQKGQSVVSHPVRIAFLVNTELTASIHPLPVLFVAAKRHFKRAHDRNRAKRLLREAYRLLQHDPVLLGILASKPIAAMSLNYVKGDQPPLHVLQKQLLKGWVKWTTAHLAAKPTTSEPDTMA